MPPSHSPADAPRPASRGTVAELEASEQAHRADPERADMLRRARLFETGWLELAEALVRARKKRSYEGWGYASFEDYTKKELRLRQEQEVVPSRRGSMAAIGTPGRTWLKGRQVTSTCGALAAPMPSRARLVTKR